MKRMKGLLMLGVTVVMMFALTGCGKVTVNLNDYITITSEGYDSMGTASYEFDYDAFSEDYSGKIKLSKKGKELSDFADLIGETADEILLDTCVGESLDKSTELSNGDEITLKWNCDDESAEKYFNVKLDYSDITYKVEGLEEIGKFNPFDYVTIEYSGIAPDGSADLNINYDMPEMQYLSFATDPASGLKNGDVIEVEAVVNGDLDSFVEKFGEVLDPAQKEYTVEGLSAYIESASELDDETLNKMIQQGKDVFMSYTANSWVDGYQISSVDYVGNYFLKQKEGYSGDKNKIYIIYKIDFIETDGNPYTFYYQVGFKNIMSDGNGKCDVDISDYTRTSDTCRYADGKYSTNGYISLDSLFETLIQSQMDSYEYEKNLNN